MNLADVLFDKIFKINEKNIEILKEKLNQEDEDTSWAFCLGAGVSMSCGFPDWAKLLAMINGKVLQSYSPTYKPQNEWLKIMSEAIQETQKNSELVEKMEGAANGNTASMYSGVDLLELAEYIRNMIKDQSEYDEESLINETLRGYIHTCYDVQYDTDGKIKGYDVSTLKAVVETMKKKNIRRAITYNYDDLLETALRREGNDVESIVPDEQREFMKSDDTYKIYHCHGLVPVDYKEDENRGKIILTETSYYNEENSSYSLANVLQAYSMNYCNLLYVGFSGADYTFRRIIRGMNQKEGKIKHYIFFCIDDIVNMVYAGTDKVLTKDDFIRQIEEGDTKYDFEKLMINQMVVSKTLYWEDKGMNVIWSTREGLPKILLEL